MLFGSVDNLMVIQRQRDQRPPETTRRTKRLNLFKEGTYEVQEKDAVTQDDGNCTGSLSGNSLVSEVLNSFVSTTTLSTIPLC